MFGGKAMNNRISQLEKPAKESDDRTGPQPIGAILDELLAQYQARFPDVRITVVQTPAVAI